MMDTTLNTEERDQTQDDPWTLKASGVVSPKELTKDYDPSEPYQGIEEPDIEFEFSETSFPVTEDNVVKVMDPAENPIQVVYKVKEELFEVKGWDLAIPLEDFSRIPKEIGRRFLQLYCASQDGSLSTEDEYALSRISDQMDYRGFAATRLVPRRLEATLIRTEPVTLIELLDDRSVKLPTRLAEKLGVLKSGDRFAAYFDLDGDGNVLDVRNVDLLPPLEDLNLEAAFDPFET